MKTKPTLRCACCSAEIKAPQWFDGKPYGWSCIKKVNPAAKQEKAKYVTVQLVSIAAAYGSDVTEQFVSGNIGRQALGFGVVLIDGVKAKFSAFGKRGFVVVQDGNVFMVDFEYEKLVEAVQQHLKG